jgi:hypothetical protein
LLRCPKLQPRIFVSDRDVEERAIRPVEDTHPDDASSVAVVESVGHPEHCREPQDPAAVAELEVREVVMRQLRNAPAVEASDRGDPLRLLAVESREGGMEDEVS